MLSPITEKSNKPVAKIDLLLFYMRDIRPFRKAYRLINKDQSNDDRERATVPARIKTNPISALTVNFSFSAKKEKAIVTKILSLSTDTTTETTPSFNAL